MKIVIPGTLPSLNEIIDASKSSRFTYVKMKDKAIYTVGWHFKFAMPGDEMPKKANYTFTWYCPNKRRDKDNIMGGQKFVFDALQKIGYIENDGWSQIGDITHRFVVDKENPRLEIDIEEVSA